jgi:hypothetical protein
MTTVVPQLKDTTIRQLQVATGLSASGCAMIRSRQTHTPPETLGRARRAGLVVHSHDSRFLESQSKVVIGNAFKAMAFQHRQLDSFP